MASTASVPTDLERRQEQAARAFIESAGFRNVRDIVFVPDDPEPIYPHAVQVAMPALRFTHWDESNRGRARAEISAVGLTIPTR